MLNKLKNLSIMTKLLYLFAFILFIVWIIPMMNTYYANVNAYEKNMKEIKMVSEKYGISTHAKKFSETSFTQDTELLFSKVSLKNMGDSLYEVNIRMKKEDLKSFHTFIETLSLRYYVEIKNKLEFKTEDEEVTVKFTLKAF